MRGKRCRVNALFRKKEPDGMDALLLAVNRSPCGPQTTVIVHNGAGAAAAAAAGRGACSPGWAAGRVEMQLLSMQH